MKWLVLAIAVAFTLGLGQAAVAAENPTGTWKWSMAGGKGGDKAAREMTLKLKLEGDKLTGTVGGGTNETAIEDGKYSDGEVSFTVTREAKGNKFVSKYSGKVSGDT